MEFEDRAPVDCEPLVALVPDHAPEAVQDVAFVADQVSVALLPLVTELGLALNVTVGTGALTETVVPWVVLPPGPAQVKE